MIAMKMFFGLAATQHPHRAQRSRLFQREDPPLRCVGVPLLHHLRLERSEQLAGRLLTARDERLCNRFDYDGEYGTVLNRFLMQASCGIPLTVYGTGGQTRAFIHISDTARCIELAVANPPKSGERVEILNQVAETARVRDIAEMVAKLTGAEVQQVSNPRQEDAENELVVSNQKFKLLGLDPITLESAEGLLTEVTEISQKYLHRVDRSKVASKAYWNKARAEAALDGAPTQVGEPAKL